MFFKKLLILKLSKLQRKTVLIIELLEVAFKLQLRLIHDSRQ